MLENGRYMSDKLRDFLNGEGVLSEFERSVRDNPTQEGHNEEAELINYAFEWRETPEGDSFWRKLSKKWRETL